MHKNYINQRRAIRERRYKGTIPTESVDVSDSPAGDLLTLTSQKPFSLKPASIFANGKFAFVTKSFFSSYLLNFTVYSPLFVPSSKGVINPRKLCNKTLLFLTRGIQRPKKSYL
jgi:hypothetical protein